MRSSVLAPLTLVALAAACAPETRTGPCTAGSESACECAGGARGAQVCGADQTWTPCFCEGVDSGPPAIDADRTLPDGGTDRLDGARPIDGGGAVDDWTLMVDRTVPDITVEQHMTYGVAVGDVDGDGDLDIFYANFGVTIGGGQPQPNELWLNRMVELGIPYFDLAPPGYLPVEAPRASRRAAFGDLDGDGDLDLVVANSTTNLDAPEDNQLYVNDGTGRFTDRTDALPAAARGGLTCAVKLFDVEGDGDLDIFFGQYGSSFGGERNHLIRNDGGLRFSDASSSLPDDAYATVDVAVGDLDGDGDLDLVTAETQPFEPNRVYLNDGGAFRVGPELPAGTGATHSVTLAALRPGRLDLLIGNLDRDDALLEGNGDGTFRVAPAGALPQLAGPTADYEAADFDDDGDLDLWVGKARNEHDGLLLNEGGRFRDATLDHDTIRYLRGTGRSAANYRLVDQYQWRLFDQHMPGQTYTHEAVIADMQNDGHPDIVAAMGQPDVGGSNRIYANVQTTAGAWGYFTFPSHGHVNRTSMAIVYYGMDVGDIDGDGDVDAVVTGRGERVMINRGGQLIDENPTRQSGCCLGGREAVALADVDGDGDLDQIKAAWSVDTEYVNLIALNDGSGHFTSAMGRLPPHGAGRHNTTDNLAVGDVDNDGDVDILECNVYRSFNPDGQQNRLLINDGRGFFSDRTAWLPRDSDRDGTYAARFGDLDGDGDLDLVYANNAEDSGGLTDVNANRVLINQGGAQGGAIGRYVTLAGGFPSGLRSTNSEDVALADLDGDGDLDCVFANAEGRAPSRIFFNDGTGRFTERAGAAPAALSALPYWHMEVEVGDLDRDGDVEIVLFDRARYPIVYLFNDGAGRFTAREDIDARFGSYAGDAELLDVNGDGLLDVYVGAWDFKVSRILHNQGLPGAPPAADAGVPMADPSETYVQRAYLGILARPAGADGLAAWAPALRMGMTVLDLCAAFYASDEYRVNRLPLSSGQLADDLYRGILERPPTSTERAAAIAELAAARGPALAASLLESPEFRSRYL